MAPRVLLVSGRTEVEEVFLHAPPGTFTLERRSPGVVQPGECAREFGVVLIDLQAVADAIALGRVLRTLNKEVQFIPVVPRAEERSGIQAVADGACDYLLWPPAEPADAWKVLSNCLKRLTGEGVSSDFKIPPELLPADPPPAAPWVPAPWAGAGKQEPALLEAVPGKPARQAETMIRPAPAVAPVVGPAVAPAPQTETVIRPAPVKEKESKAETVIGPPPLAKFAPLVVEPRALAGANPDPKKLAASVSAPVEPSAAPASDDPIDLMPPSMKRGPARGILAVGSVLFAVGVAGSWFIFGRSSGQPQPPPTVAPRSTPSLVQALVQTPLPVPSSTPTMALAAAIPEPPVRPSNPVNRVARPAKGALSVWVDGWANVYVDGQKLGQTAPFVGLPFPSGKHKVTLENPTRGRRDYEVSIAPGQTTVLRGAL